MSAKGFKKLCRDFGLFDRNFLPVDSEIAFAQVLAEISTLDTTDPLRSHIIFDKRIELPIFIMFLIPELAELKQQTTNEVIELMVAASNSQT